MTGLLVVLGAAVGAPARLLLERAVRGLRGTLAVNVLGSAFLGGLVHTSPSTMALLGTGFCGAFTTYSTFAVETARSRSWRYALVTALLCLSAAALTRAVMS